MDSKFVAIILTEDSSLRNTPLEKICEALSFEELIQECHQLDLFRRENKNLYHRVRSLLFLYAIYRFYLPPALILHPGNATISFRANKRLLERRFTEAIDDFLKASEKHGLSDAICSALAKGYHQLAIQNLADQVRSSVRAVRGNQWMFRTGCVFDLPVLIKPQLLEPKDGMFPLIHEQTAVRMDLSHSSWSDVFFLGMDFPEGARVLNISINLAVHGRDPEPKPPVEAFFRITDEPTIRLCSVDLGAAANITELDDIFNFGKDYLGLLKAALIASGLIPIGMEGSGQNLAAILQHIVGRGKGIELVSHVNDIPKGSRLAVSTNLLGALISACMRATGQTRSLEGPLHEDERRIVAARAILGEWLGGSGGGWQDSGGIWPGIKTICGAAANTEDPEYGVSRGRLLPKHTVLTDTDVSHETRQKLQDSLVLVHGGMAQNVGPILEMVTEKYLLRSEKEWLGRQQSINMFDEILAALRAGNIKDLGALTTKHFFGPLQTIIPWATTFYTERLIHDVRATFGEDFWGFWMLGGMSGGGMGFIFEPSRKREALDAVQKIMNRHKQNLEHSLPFAMNPVVYDFSINENGTTSRLTQGSAAMLPSGYYNITLPPLLRGDTHSLTPNRRREVELFSHRCDSDQSLASMMQSMMLDQTDNTSSHQLELEHLLSENGFDKTQHEQIRADLRNGSIGLAKNRLPSNTLIEDAHLDDLTNAESGASSDDQNTGLAALANGEVAVVTLAAGAASRWTEGAGVVKALHPFCKFGNTHRTFLEVHLAKTRQSSKAAGTTAPHIITTSFVTHDPINDFLQRTDFYGMADSVHLSHGRSVGLRLVPTTRDLRFEWQDTNQQVLDERAQKVRESSRAALLKWAESIGEGSDYTDNLPLQCLHPVGHWFEVPNLFLNGTLHALLSQRPQLRTLLLHNVDTLGANLDPGLLGIHRRSRHCLSFEVIRRRLEDRGGGLARVNGHPRLVEGLAMPRPEDEFNLSFYNTNSCWIDIDLLLTSFELTRDQLHDQTLVAKKIRDFGKRIHTYVTLKEVKKRWGHGQEDKFPVAQFEKLWGDMTAIDSVTSGFILVPRMRGQQLKEQAQLDSWLRDGSHTFVDQLCAWTNLE